MRKPVQELAGALARSGQQPVDASTALAAATGSPSDGIAAPNAVGGTQLERLGRLIVQNEQVIELLERVVELLEEVRNAQ